MPIRAVAPYQFVTLNKEFPEAGVADGVESAVYVNVKFVGVSTTTKFPLYAVSPQLAIVIFTHNLLQISYETHTKISNN